MSKMVSMYLLVVKVFTIFMVIKRSNDINNTKSELFDPRVLKNMAWKWLQVFLCIVFMQAKLK